MTDLGAVLLSFTVHKVTEVKIKILINLEQGQRLCISHKLLCNVTELKTTLGTARVSTVWHGLWSSSSSSIWRFCVHLKFEKYYFRLVGVKH